MGSQCEREPSNWWELCEPLELIDVHYAGFLRRSHQRWDDVQLVPPGRHSLPDRDSLWCLAVDFAKQNNRRVFKWQCLLTTLFIKQCEGDSFLVSFLVSNAGIGSHSDQAMDQVLLIS